FTEEASEVRQVFQNKRADDEVKRPARQLQRLMEIVDEETYVRACRSAACRGEHALGEIDCSHASARGHEPGRVSASAAPEVQDIQTVYVTHGVAHMRLL